MESRRRSLLCLAGASAMAPLSLLAQPKDPKRIVWIDAGEPVRLRVREEFKSRGIVEGRDIALTFQAGFGFQDEQAADAIVRSEPHVIVVLGDGPFWPLRKRTRDIPIVFYNMKPDPVDFGLIESLARPGGNLTGSTLNATEWAKKQVEILKRLNPSLRLLGGLADKGVIDEFARVEPDFAARSKLRMRDINAQFGIDNVVVQVSEDLNRDEIARMVRASGIQAVMRAGRSPAAREFMVSAPIRGERPSVIPVYQVRIEYALNRRRAREIGIEIPPAVLIGAREIYD